MSTRNKCKIFFHTIRQTANPVSYISNILMTDDTESCANGWRHVFGPSAQHCLLCAQNVKRAWRQNFSNMAGDAVLQATEYENLPDVAQFSELLQKRQWREIHLWTSRETSQQSCFCGHKTEFPNDTHYYRWNGGASETA